MSETFKKNVEDFTCDTCGAEVLGSGYTNHCPHCLFSKHVDSTPGDRQHTCQGMMQPVGVLQEGGVESLLHRCLVCGVEKKNKIAENDSRDAIITVSSHES